MAKGNGSVTQVKLEGEAARQAVALGYDPIAYLTQVRPGWYDACVVRAGSEATTLVCECYPRANALNRVAIWLNDQTLLKARR